MAFCNCAYTPPESRPCLNCRRRARDAGLMGKTREELIAALEAELEGRPQVGDPLPGPIGPDPIAELRAALHEALDGWDEWRNVTCALDGEQSTARILELRKLAGDR